MYSPKIYEKHIPTLYRLSRLKKIPMTRLVNQIIEDYLQKLKAKHITQEIFFRRQHEKSNTK